MNIEKMSDYDRHCAVKDWVRNRPEMTNKEIAEQLGYSYGYVAQLRRSVPREIRREQMMRLRMAAPDLLEALQQMCNQYKHYTIVENDEIYAKAINAISKAQGNEKTQ